MRFAAGAAVFFTPYSRLMLALAISLMVHGAAFGQSDSRALRAYYTANGLLNRGLYEEAAAEYLEFIESKPSGVELATARYGLAVALSQIAQPADALEQLDLIDAPPGFAFQFESGLLRAQLLYTSSDFGAAAEKAGQLTRTGSDHPQAHIAAGLWIECLYRSEEHAAAVRHAREVLSHGALSGSDTDRAALFGGLSLSILGENEIALQLIRPVSERDDELGNTASLSLASLLTRLDESDEAAALYRKIAALENPNWSPQAFLGLARIRRAEGSHDEAIELIERIDADFPGSVVAQESRLELGINLIESGRGEAGRKALDGVDAAASLALASRAAYWQAKSVLRDGDPAGAVSAFEAALVDFQESPVLTEILYDLGVARADLGDAEGALEAFQSVRNDHPNHRLFNAALLAEATTLLGMGQLGESRQAASQVDPDTPESAEAQLVIAEVDAQLGDHQAAVGRLVRWLDSYSETADADRARFRLSMSLATLGRLDDAESAWTGMHLDGGVPPDFRVGFVVLGDAAFQAQDWTRAERWYRQAVDQNVEPSNAALLKLGLTHARQNRHAEALPFFQQAAQDQLGGDASTQAMFELGQSHLMLGNDIEASAAFSTLLMSDPSSRFGVHAMRQLGGIAERSGAPDTAASWYEQAAESGGETAQASRRDLARALLAAGAYEHAIKLAESWDDPDLNAYAGIAVARGGNPIAAIVALDSALRAGDLGGEVRSSALLEKAWCERQLGDAEASIESLTILMDDGGEDRYTVYAALEAASIELEADRIESAERWLQHAGEILNAHPEVSESAMLAQLDLRTAQHAQAIGEHQRVIERLESFDERHPERELRVPAAILLGDARIELRQPELAAAAYERAVQSAEGEIRATAMLRLGDAFGRAKQWSRSREDFEQFLETYPESEFAFEAEFGRAWALENEGEHERAREGYARVIESHNGETAARAQFQIGECLFAEGRLEDAVRELLRVDILYDYPEWSAAALYEAGRAFEQLRKFGEARQQYREIGERFGDSTWAILAADRLTALSKAD